MAKENRGCTLVILLIFIGGLAISQAAAATVLAQIVLKPVDGQTGSVLSAANAASLSNCKHLVDEIYNIVVVRVECNTLEDLKIAVATELLPMDGITGSTLWIDQPSP